MQPRTEEMLYFLLWTADTMLQPTWRNVHDSFEEWAWRNRLSRRLAELEREKLIERHPDPDMSRVVRLTDAGRTLALGGRDPVERWSRAWDGSWRMVLFDLPTRKIDLRRKLLRTLHRSHFGYLQNSVWITPDPVAKIHDALGGLEVQADAFIVMEGHPAAGESDAEIVRAAWHFDAINRGYESYLQFTKSGIPARSARLAWALREQRLWKEAVRKDPFLTNRLLPAGYAGQRALQARKRVLAALAAERGRPAEATTNVSHMRHICGREEGDRGGALDLVRCG